MPRGDRNQWTGVSTEQRFWMYVDKRGVGGCWIWKGALNNNGRNSPRQLGYARMKGDNGRILAHRYAYELLVGPIPEGYTIDHLCRVPSCVNPKHLEAVTMAENLRRGNGAPMQRHRRRVMQGREDYSPQQRALDELRKRKL